MQSGGKTELSTNGENVFGGVVVNFAGTQHHTLKVLVVDGIWHVLGLQAKGIL